MLQNFLEREIIMRNHKYVYKAVAQRKYRIEGIFSACRETHKYLCVKAKGFRESQLDEKIIFNAF
jgi:hypothetical protein